MIRQRKKHVCTSRTAVVHLNFRAGSTLSFPFTVCTVHSSMDRTSRCNKVEAVRLYAHIGWIYFYQGAVLCGRIRNFDVPVQCTLYSVKVGNYCLVDYRERKRHVCASVPKCASVND